MFLLEGLPAPDHAKIARFRTLHFAPFAKEIFAEMAEMLWVKFRGKIFLLMAQRLNHVLINTFLFGRKLLLKI